METKKQFFFMRAAMTLLVMLCSLGAWADDSGSCGTNVTYSYVESTHTLTISGTGDMEDYDSSDIPWKYYKSSITSVVIGEGVTSIGNNAFQNCTNLSSVTIPASVTSIGNNAFMSCTNLSYVTIPASVTSIGNNAFQNCTSLSSVTIPASVTSIGNYAFAGCTSLSSITIPASVTSIKPNVFYGCTNLSSVTIPTSVTSIGGAAFSGCTSLSSITIPASVTSIGQAVFHSCTSLSSVTIPASVTSIQDNVFYGCTSLSSVTIPASVTSIGNYAFQNSGLTAVSFAEGSKLNIIGKNAFQSCTNLSSVTIPAGVTKIDQGAFYGCTSLRSIIVYATNPPKLGANAVASNASGRKIYVPKAKVDSYKTAWSAYSDAIEANPIEVSGTCGRTGHENEVTWLLTGTPGNFLLTISGTGDMENYDSSDIPWKDYKVGITSVMIGEDVTSIGNYAFSDCEVLTSIAIPAGVTSIGKHAFDGCSNLATVTVYAPECSLGDYAFYGCDKLANIYVFSDLVDDYKAAWSAYADKITGMTPVASGTCGKDTPEDVTWRLEGEAGHYRLIITDTGDMADYIYLNTRPWHNYSENIKTIVIENGVTSIGESAFNDCEKLTTVSIPASVTSIGNYAFGYCSALTSIEIPASVTTIGEEAFNNTALTSIEIPASVTSIGNGAFIDCEKLTSITVAEGNANYSNDTNGVLFNKEKTTLIKYPKGNNAYSYVIPTSVTSICEKAFKGCEDLETVTLPPNVTSIGDDAFNNTALTSIEIPASVTSIGNSAFEECSSLTTVNILANVTSIGDDAFMHCSNLQSIEIHAKVTSIGKRAFNVCSSLASVTLNNNPTIGEYAFFDNITVTMNLAAAEVDGAKWTTFYNNYGNFQADENTEVYKGTVSGSELVLTAISDKIVNAGNAVILKSTDKPVMTLTTTNSSDDFTDNVLKGLSERTEIATSAYSANTIYVMGNTAKNGFGFHRYTGAYMPANKAFLALSSGSSAPLRMVIDDEEETTGVASMADGIDDMSDVWYTLDGRKLNSKPTTKGLYIVNGKKVMIK